MPSIFPCWVAYKEKDKLYEERRLTTFRVIEKRLFKSVVERMQIGDVFGIWSYSGKLVAELSRNVDGFFLQQLISFPLRRPRENNSHAEKPYNANLPQE
jgi:hypothetical protein